MAGAPPQLVADHVWGHLSSRGKHMAHARLVMRNTNQTNQALWLSDGPIPTTVYLKGPWAGEEIVFQS